MLSCVQLFVTPWTVACQAPLSMGILQAKILEWVALPSFRGTSQPRDWTQVSHVAGGFLPAEPPGKPKNTGVGSLSLLQGIFPTQESNLGLLHCKWILYQLSYQGSPEYYCEGTISLVPTSSDVRWASGSDKPKGSLLQHVRIPVYPPEPVCYVIPSSDPPNPTLQGKALCFLNQPRLLPGLECSCRRGKMQSLLQNRQRWQMAEKIKFSKLLLQNQTHRCKSGGSDCLSSISLNCPPFASPWETDNRRKPPMESENTSPLVLRWIQAANSSNTFRKLKTRNLRLKRSLSDYEMMPFLPPWKCKLVWPKLCPIRAQWKWNTHKNMYTEMLAPRPGPSVLWQCGQIGMDAMRYNH